MRHGSLVANCRTIVHLRGLSRAAPPTTCRPASRGSWRGLGVPALRNEPPRPGEFTLLPRALIDKLGADYGQISVHGTPAPLSGAKALPFASHVDIARSYWSNGILWSILADSATTDGSYTLFEELCPEGSGAPPQIVAWPDPFG
jgi:hypothetical protein